MPITIVLATVHSFTASAANLMFIKNLHFPAKVHHNEESQESLQNCGAKQR
jgi:hypothetical protein